MVQQTTFLLPVTASLELHPLFRNLNMAAGFSNQVLKVTPNAWDPRSRSHSRQAYPLTRPPETKGPLFSKRILVGLFCQGHIVI